MALDYLAYQQSVKSPLEMAAAGYQTGLQARELQESRALAEQKREQAAEVQADLASLAAIDNPTTKDYTAIMLKHPSLGESLKTPFEQLSKEQQDSERRTALNIYAALDSGTPEIANEILQRNIDAATNSGDQKRADSFKILQQQLSIDPKAAKSTAGLFLMSALGPEKFGENMERLQEGSRKQELQKGLLDQKAADLGLTKANTNKVLKETEKLGADVKVALLKLEAAKQGVPGAIIEPKDKLDAENKLRDDYFSQTKDFRSVQEAYRRIGATEDTAAGDLSLIFSYMKMLDPGSVVREGEFATAQNTAGVPERVINIYNKLLTGERLSAGQRKAFIGQGKKLFDAAGKSEKEVRNLIDKSAKTYGLNKDNIFPDVEPTGMAKEPSVIEPPANLTPEQLMQEADKILQGGQ